MSQPTHKLMERVYTWGFLGKCKCGHTHRFKGEEINLNNSNASIMTFNNNYQCPQCGTSYDGMYENRENRKKKYTPLGLLVTSLLIFGLLFGGYKLYNIVNPPINTDINHATKQQLQDFYKWDQKQQQQKRDNQPAFNTNK